MPSLPDDGAVERVVVAARGDMHHLIQPVIGQMRILLHRGESAPPARLDDWVRRLYVALEVADAFGDEDARKALAHKEGLGVPVTPESQERMVAALREMVGDSDA